jgi:acyl-CoA thioester hydrolase
VLVMSDIPTIDDYPHVAEITTRWNDNDVYGHVNNVIFYSYFDSVANAYLIEEGGLDVHGSDVIGLVVESGCAYHAPIEYPAKLRIGLRVDRLGNRSVTYGLGVFADGEDAVAHGYFSHVFVDRETRRPTAIPIGLREALQRLVVA